MSDETLSRVLDCSFSICKWYGIQILVLSLMPYLGDGLFNVSSFCFIFLYTVIFRLYWEFVPKEKRISWILYPYVGYVLLAVIFNVIAFIISSDENGVSFLWTLLFLPLVGLGCVVIGRVIKKFSKRILKRRTCSRLLSYGIILILLVVLKLLAIFWGCAYHGSTEGEKKEVLERMAYLENKILTSPRKLIDEMPDFIGAQFKGEWALYSCSMFSAALVNISYCYPETKKGNLVRLEHLINMVMSSELRAYDVERWDEDPLESLDGNQSHISYLSHLAWMICNYKEMGGKGIYDDLLDSICETMNRRILTSPCLNLQTYPGESIYIPDMLVAIVALKKYADMHHGRYQSTVRRWLRKANESWIDNDTGLLVSFLQQNGAQHPDAPVKGSYAALNCYYLTLVDEAFAKEQYQKLKSIYWKDGVLSGLKEYYNQSCYIGMDIDAGPILWELSPSGTAFYAGPATYFADQEIRSKILRTAEIAGHTVSWNGSRHYLLANVAVVGEAIMLAMRTNQKF